MPVNIATARKHHHASATWEFLSLAACVKYKSYQAFKAKVKDLDCNAKAKDLMQDFGLKDQLGQGLTSLVICPAAVGGRSRQCFEMTLYGTVRYGAYVLFFYDFTF